jgi:adenine-specific DNA-methyltransferase
MLVKQSQHPNIWFYIGLLNSSLLNFYYREISQEGGRVLAEVKPQRLRSLPLADSSPATRSTITELVRRTVAAKKKNPAADTSGLEREIDQQVYALYGLTPEEIKIVESASVQTSARQGNTAK